MLIGIHGKPFKAHTAEQVIHLFDLLKQNSVSVALSDSFMLSLQTAGIDISSYAVFNHSKNIPPLDGFISIGGDGTMLESVTYVGRKGTPIVGINTGRLGFLATMNADDTEIIVQRLLTREYSVEERSLVELKSVPAHFSDFPYALNEFTIMRNDTSSMIMVRVWVDGELLNVYWADGLIVSTPTGSTGYSLSCGGSLLAPDCHNFIITAVSPHNLGTRSIILSDHVKIRLQIEGRHPKLLSSMDSRKEMVDEGIEVHLQRADFYINLVHFSDQHYFKTLRQKLHWGMDQRN